MGKPEPDPLPEPDPVPEPLPEPLPVPVPVPVPIPVPELVLSVPKHPANRVAPATTIVPDSKNSRRFSFF